MSAREQGLEVHIVDGRLSITIGIDALMVAARGADVWPDEGDLDAVQYRIDDADGFAQDILTELIDEEEDGTTLIHIAIDTAVERALDAGSLNIDYGTGDDA